MAAEKELSISYLPADKSGKILELFRGSTAEVKAVWEKLWRTHKIKGKLMRQANLQRGGKPMGRMMAGAVVVVSWDNTMAKTENKKTIWGDLYVPEPKVAQAIVADPAKTALLEKLKTAELDFPGYQDLISKTAFTTDEKLQILTRVRDAAHADDLLAELEKLSGVGKEEPSLMADVEASMNAADANMGYVVESLLATPQEIKVVEEEPVLAE